MTRWPSDNLRTSSDSLDKEAVAGEYTGRIVLEDFEKVMTDFEGSRGVVLTIAGRGSLAISCSYLGRVQVCSNNFQWRPDVFLKGAWSNEYQVAPDDSPCVNYIHRRVLASGFSYSLAIFHLLQDTVLSASRWFFRLLSFLNSEPQLSQIWRRAGRKILIGFQRVAVMITFGFPVLCVMIWKLCSHLVGRVLILKRLDT